MAISAMVTSFTPLLSPSVAALSEQSCYDKYNGVEKDFAKKSDFDKYKATFVDDKCGKAQGGICTFTGDFVAGSGHGAVSIKCKTPSASSGGTIDGCGSIQTSIIKCDTSKDNPILSIVLQVVNFLAVGVGIAVAGGITWGGFLYTQANGNSGKTQEAVTVITNSIIGLLAFIFMYAIINWLVPGGLFN